LTFLKVSSPLNLLPPSLNSLVEFLLSVTPEKTAARGAKIRLVDILKSELATQFTIEFTTEFTTEFTEGLQQTFSKSARHSIDI